MLKYIVLLGLILHGHDWLAQTSNEQDSVMYISSEERLTFQWTEFVFVDELAPGEEGGMGENWELNFGHWSDKEWRIEWSPLSLKTEDDKSLDSLLHRAAVLNAQFYMVDSFNGLAINAGEGYGTFDHTQYRYFGDTVVVAITDCVGHCSSSPPTAYVKICFNSEGFPLFKVRYPLDYSEAYFFERDSITPQAANHYLSDLASTAGQYADTTYFEVSSTLTSGIPKWKLVQDVSLYVMQALSDANTGVHQVYLSGKPMEDEVKSALGMCPALLVLELYRNGAVYFWFNKTVEKYYYCGVHSADRLIED